MIRTQVQLSEAQLRRLRRFAQRERISLAAAIRRCVDTVLDEGDGDLAAAYRRAASLVGAFRDPDPAAAVSQDHDRYLEQAFR